MKPHALFLRVGCLLPRWLELVQEPFCEGWMFVEDTAAATLDIKLRSGGWHFMWLTEARSCRGIGRTAESAGNKAITLALRRIKQRFNTAELILVEVTKYCGLHVARAILQTRQIQQHASLGLVDEIVLREVPVH